MNWKEEFSTTTWKVPVAYTPTYPFVNTISARHHQLLNAPYQDKGPKIQYSLPGSLRREDAAKLYELAYFAKGNVLEVGSAQGLSTLIMCEAMIDAKREGIVHSVDMNNRQVQSAIRNLRSKNLDNFKVDCEEGARWLQAQHKAGNQYGFAFVDHSHEYEPVRTVAKELIHVLAPGSYVAFHDFLDVRNDDPLNHNYNVWKGVLAGLDPSAFKWDSCCGCMGIFKRL